MTRARVRAPLVVAAAVVVLSGACAPTEHASFGPEAALGVARGHIQGGTIDRTHTFAVGIVTNGETCSGALIAPNLVLTARHCVSPGGGDVVDCSVDTFGSPGRASLFSVTTDAVATDSSAYHAVAKILTPPGKKFCGNDIALLILSDLVSPDEAVPIAPVVEAMTDHPRYQVEVALIGYGITAPRKNDEGTRRVREHVSLVCTPGDPVIPCGSLTDYDITEAEFVVSEGACTGDSGGSAIDQASLAHAPVTFGVLSRAAETATKCTEATFTRTDAFKEFLIAGAEEAATAGDYPKPVWAGGVDPTASDAGTGDAAPPSAAPGAGTDAPSASGCSTSSRPAPGAWWALLVLAAVRWRVQRGRDAPLRRARAPR